MRSPRPLLSVFAVLGAVALGACGSSSNSANRHHTVITVTRTVTVAPTSTTTAPLTPTTATGTITTPPPAAGIACSASDLTPSFLGSNGAAGTIEFGFALKNTGAKPCHTYGWPGVQLLSSSGAALPTNATRTTGDLVGDTPPTLLTLAPGEQASFRLIASDFASGGGNCPNATQLQIYAPDDTVTMVVGITGGVPACGKATLSPMMAGTSAFSQ